MSKRNRSIVAAVLLLAAAALAIAAIASAATGGAPTTTPPATTSIVAAAPATADAFGVFRRPQRPSDRMPEPARQSLAVPATAAGVDLDGARAVATSDGGPVWALPGTDRVCLAVPDPVDGFAISCGSIEHALAGRLWTGLVGMPGQTVGDIRAAVLVPDDVPFVTAVATDDATRTIDVTDNVAFADLARSSAIQYTDSNGDTIALSVPGTPPALLASP